MSTDDDRSPLERRLDEETNAHPDASRVMLIEKLLMHDPALGARHLEWLNVRAGYFQAETLSHVEDRRSAVEVFGKRRQ